jgi:hypothetical protein
MFLILMYIKNKKGTFSVLRHLAEFSQYFQVGSLFKLDAAGRYA